MTKDQLIRKTADMSEATIKKTREIVTNLLGVIEDALAHGEELDFSPVGHFRIRSYPERQGINPQTKEVVTIPASKRVVFKVSVGLKAKVKKA